MIFIITLDNFSLNNVSLLEKKKNIIMDGTFTKINYLSEWYTMNGLCLYASLDVKYIYDNSIKFDPKTINNTNIIKQLSNIEKQLLILYSNYYQCDFTLNNLLSKQLHYGSLKISSDCKNNANNIYIIKISGIWQSNNEIGIIYKTIKSSII